MNAESAILSRLQAGKKMLAVLLDPENLTNPESVERIGVQLRTYRPDLIFVGGSTWYESVTPLVKALRSYVNLPIILFPGHPSQFSSEVDAVLFHSLLSSDKAEMLIGWQSEAARAVRDSGVEVISMGYILVDGGKESTTARVTGTKAMSLENPDKIINTALAGELLGMQTIYLEAGSGAANPVQSDLIREVKRHLRVPLIVGGGICCRETVVSAWQAGADVVVVGNWLESHPEDLASLVDASNQ